MLRDEPCMAGRQTMVFTLQIKSITALNQFMSSVRGSGMSTDVKILQIGQHIYFFILLCDRLGHCRFNFLIITLRKERYQL